MSFLSVGVDDFEDDPDNPGTHGEAAVKKQKLDNETKTAPIKQVQVQRGAGGGMACPFCKTLFPSEAEFVDHLNKAHKSKVLMKCKDCDFKAKTGEEIRAHREKEHSQAKPAPLLQTAENGTNAAPKNESREIIKPAPKVQQLEVKSGHGGATKCPFCKLVFPAEAEFVEHLSKVHNSKVLMKCRDCDFKAHTGAEIRSHREQEHGQPMLTLDQSKVTEARMGQKVMEEERPLIDVGDEAKLAKNPNLSPSELITEAMLKHSMWASKGMITLSDIFNYISQKYPYFKPNNMRWKNWISQTLFDDPLFVKTDDNFWRMANKIENEGGELDVGDKPQIHKNPNLSSSELITEAMLKHSTWSSQGRIRLSDIFKYISQKYPYFKPSNQRWKNRVSQTLYENPRFVKDGMFWRMAEDTGNEGEEVDVRDFKEEEKVDDGEKCDVCMVSLGPGTTLLEHYRQQHILQQG